MSDKYTIKYFLNSSNYSWKHLMTQQALVQSDLPLNDTNLLSSQGWYNFGQKLIESTYLQPFKCTSNGFQKNRLIKNYTHIPY